MGGISRLLKGNVNLFADNVNTQMTRMWALPMTALKRKDR